MYIRVCVRVFVLLVSVFQCAGVNANVLVSMRKCVYMCVIVSMCFQILFLSVSVPVFVCVSFSVFLCISVSVCVSVSLYVSFIVC